MVITFLLLMYKVMLYLEFALSSAERRVDEFQSGQFRVETLRLIEDLPDGLGDLSDLLQRPGRALFILAVVTHLVAVGVVPDLAKVVGDDAPPAPMINYEFI